jgi:hypothetical protein
MAGTASVSAVTTAYTSLGTGPMLISPQGPVMIIASASQPLATAVGHGLDFLSVPFPFTLAEQVWAIALNSNCNVIVTT